MRVQVDKDLCQGHGICHTGAPTLFFLGESDGLAYVLSEEVSADQEEQALLATDTCPERAIIVTP